MKAIIWTGYGSPDHLQLREAPQPVPTDSEMLIRIHAASLSTPDTELRRLNLPLWSAVPIRLYLGVLKPTRITILGGEFAGEVIQAGKNVTRYKPGDQVYGYTGLRMGTHAEYICLAEKSSGLGGVMAPKPANLTYEEAAVVPFGALEAMHTLRQAAIQPGQRVLIVGAGGSIGTYAVQLARQAGAEVTGVDSAGKLEMLRSLGAAHVIDYAQQDFTQNGQTYNVILDTINKSPFFGSLRSLKENGYYLNASPGLSGRLWLALAGRNSSKKVLPWSAGYTTANLQAVTALVEAGTIRPVIDRRYTLAQVTEAHRYVESGQKKGNVIIQVTPDSGA